MLNWWGSREHVTLSSIVLLSQFTETLHACQGFCHILITFHSSMLHSSPGSLVVGVLTIPFNCKRQSTREKCKEIWVSLHSVVKGLEEEDNINQAW